MRPIFSLLILCAMLVLCTACGKRADMLDPPEGGNPRAFPRYYPDISTDPSGVSVTKPKKQPDADDVLQDPYEDTVPKAYPRSYPDTSTDPSGIPISDH
jgi:hypothetical protein